MTDDRQHRGGGVEINYEGMPARELVKHLLAELDNHRQINGLSLTPKGRMILAAIRAIEQPTNPTTDKKPKATQ